MMLIMLKTESCILGSLLIYRTQIRQQAKTIGITNKSFK